jgi:hypothetical protein
VFITLRFIWAWVLGLAITLIALLVENVALGAGWFVLVAIVTFGLFLGYSNMLLSDWHATRAPGHYRRPIWPRRHDDD